MGLPVRLRRSALAVVATTTLALGLGASAGSRTAAAFDGAQLSVISASFGGQSLLAVDVEVQNGGSSGEAPGLAARIDVNAPEGYGFDLSGTPGQNVGQLIGTLVSADGSDYTLASGAVVVDDPATWAADPVAQACAPGPHAALWRASPTVLGRTVGIPIAVDTVASPTGTSYVLHICPSQAPSTAFPRGVSMQSVSLLLPNGASVPTTPGIYRWSAVVTPATPVTLTPQPAAAFELRAVVRVPELLTMRTHYEPKTHTVAVSGTVTAAGAPWAGVNVDLLSSTGGSGPPLNLGSVPTAANGTFSARFPATQSETISAGISPPPHTCTAPSTAPGGCLSETDTPPAGVDSTVLVPRATDPQLVVRGRDQALAQSSVLRSTDLPQGIRVASAPLPCTGFAPHLHRLTATGQATSDVFASGDQRTVGYAEASVLRTADEARADFAGVAQLAALRCETNALVSGQQGEKIVGIGPLRTAKIGDASRAFRSQVSDPFFGRVTTDLLFVRVSRVVITLRIYSLGSPNRPLDVQVAKLLARRALFGS